MTLVDRHLAFVAALRAAGVPVSVAEDVDAAEAWQVVGVSDREAMRAAYAATLVKKPAHRAPFDVVFDLYWPPRTGDGPGTEAESEPSPSDLPVDDATMSDLRARVEEALLSGEGMEAVAAAIVLRLGRIPGRVPGQQAWSTFNVMNRLDPDRLHGRLLQALAEQRLGAGTPSGWAQARDVRRVEDLLASFRAAVEGEVRRRLAEDLGPDRVARTSVGRGLDQLDLLHARRADLDAMRREIYPLARRLATRLTRERHRRRGGSLDMRRTVRASLSTGGVPLAPQTRGRRPSRVELVVLCDVSGSVIPFAHFTLLLVFALREQFARVRAFTFVDDVSEVTDAFVPGADTAATLEELAARSRHAARMGRTDYGRAFRGFAERFEDAVGPKTSLLVLGDARSNYTDPGLRTLAGLVGAARHAYWLNPEHRRQWDTGDSAASRFAQVVPMTECRTLAQLAEFVHDLA